MEAAFQLPRKSTHPSFTQLTVFFVIFAAVIITFIIIGYTKGPKLHWRWGIKPGDNLDDDI